MGKWIAYVSDRTGEDEIYIVPQDGLGPEEQITSGHKGFMFQPQWSTDSSKIAWGDQELRLWYVDIKEKKPVQVDRAKYGEIHNYAWSPDSQWLVYDKPEDTGYSIVYLYGLVDRKITSVTSPLNNSFLRFSIRRSATFIFFPTATSTKYWAMSILNSPIPKLHVSIWSH